MKGMVVAPQPIAVEEGAKVLKEGGNAIDAAVVTAFVQGVVDPQMCGVGGFGTMHIYMAKTKEEKIIDFHGRAGSKVDPAMWENKILREARDGFGFVLKGSENDVGYRSITTPGTVMGLFEALTRYGTISWEQAIDPAIRWASEGFPVSDALARYWRRRGDTDRVDPLTRLQTTRASADLYIKEDGSPYDAGDVITNLDLAKTLTKLAREGPDVFYRGEIAEIMVEDIAKNGGFITLDDLRSYQVKVADPVAGTYRGYTVASNPPPGGGVTIIEMLHILEGYDLTGKGLNTVDYIDTVSKAMKAAMVDRVNLVGDPDFADVPVQILTSKECARQWRERIDRSEEIVVPRWKPPENPYTTHVSTLDRDGNAVALTHTLGASSGVITPGLGFQYNNAMIAFNPVPGGVNSIAPGKSRVTGMAPTMVFKDGKLHLVVGAPGGTRIMTGILQVLLNIMDHGMSMVEAVYQPRFDCQGEILFMQARIPSYVADQLKLRGYNVERSPSSYGGFALVHGIKIDGDSVQGGADPGGDGMTLAVWHP